MGEGLLHKTRLKIGGTDEVTGYISWRRHTTGLGYGLLPLITIRSAINTGIIAG
jgi:hypothetical protein